MHKRILLLLFFFCGISLYAQLASYDEVLEGEINTDRTLDANKKYLLRGFVNVNEGATLAIPAGTIIYGEKSSKGTLIINRGAKINAVGTPSRPIIFTSQQPAGQRGAGDWGGIIIAGKARINVPGGTAVIEGGTGTIYGGGDNPDDNDNSGRMSYVRIEFPGIAFLPDNEINGLTLAAVGRGTTIDHIQVSYAGDDSYEFFGGTVNAKYLISYKGVDDEFDTDFGYRGNLQFLVAYRDFNVADISGSNGFESDNDGTGTLNEPRTRPIFSNVTMVGPLVTPDYSGYNPNFKRGLHLRRSTLTSLYNSIVMGYPVGLYLDGENSVAGAQSDSLQIRNTIIAGSQSGKNLTTNVSGFDVASWFKTPSYSNHEFATSAEVKLTDPFNQNNPNAVPMGDSPAASGASFDNPRLIGGFFEVVNYIGAFDPSGVRWDEYWANYDPQNTDYTVSNGGGNLASYDEVLEGEINTDRTLDANKKYLLRGFVNVNEGATLTIPAGTIIYGEKSSKGTLIINRGAKINAVGTPSRPIIFTSQQPAGQRGAGDWGGIIIAGKARINVPGGTAVIEGGTGTIYGGGDNPDDNDNSGRMSYVRIEFPGIAFLPDNEINGLTLAAVGRGTTIDHIQVSYAGDDSYEFFGGTVNAKYLISYKGVDDEFDTDFGYRGNLQFLVAYRDFNVADISGSNGFESDNDGTGTLNEPRTRPIFSNVTMVGPLVTPDYSGYNPNFKRGLHLRRSTLTSLYNSIVMGYPVGLYLDGENSVAGAQSDSLQIRNTIIAGSQSGKNLTTNVSGFDVASWFKTPSYSNHEFATSAEVKLTDPFNQNNPNAVPMGDSPAASGASFDNPRLIGGFFEVVNYIGAFDPSGVRWDEYWANYDPQFTDYTITSVEEEYTNIIPAGYELSQNYPNPFNPTTTISFVLPKSGNVKLTVYNVLGQEIEKLINGYKEAGKYNITWNANNLPSGLYIYRLETENYVVSKKMTLLK
ncbi:T9SS type A sorting domain-containing protein [Melioribacter sp. OK-6-Me]|uniref:T9SS type A sorting domain-containing protein n=1 Tax=Melioribacter sp. OK-6-Me TaxID=3423433 RepID=UPI003EDA818C